MEAMEQGQDPQDPQNPNLQTPGGEDNYYTDPITLQPIKSYLDLPHPALNPYIDQVMHMVFGSSKVQDVNSPYGIKTGRPPLFLPTTNFEPQVAGVSKGKKAMLREDPIGLMRNMLIGDDPLLKETKPLPTGQAYSTKGIPAGLTVTPKVNSSYNILNILHRNTDIPMAEITKAIDDYTGAGYMDVREVRKRIQLPWRRDAADMDVHPNDAIRKTEILSKLIEVSPPYQGALYRAEANPVSRSTFSPSTIPPDQFKVGGQFEAPVLSFSSKINRTTASGTPLFVMEPGAKAFPVAGVSAFMENELLSGGRFVITGIENLGAGGGVTTRTIIRIRQLDPPKMMTPTGMEMIDDYKRGTRGRGGK